MIYSKKIFLFIEELKTAIKHVLAREVGLKVFGDRFYDWTQRHSFPISVVVYNDKNMLAYFESEFFEIGFHQCLMHVDRFQLVNIVRHEIAHYLAFIKYGTAILPHGSEFKSICKQLGWNEDVFGASMIVEAEARLPNDKDSSVLRKIEKLMALSTSSNPNEAEQALIKSQQLLLKYNIESKYIGNEDETFVLKRILKQKRRNSKMSAIAQILKTFFVSTVYNNAREYTYLEILGSKVNIEIAEYVAGVLELEFDRLWLQAKRQMGLKGMVAKNSFFLGIARGYCNKVNSLMETTHSEASSGLMVIEKQLVEICDRVYDRLSSTKSNASYCPSSAALGETMGKQLSINPALNRSPKQSESHLVHLN